AAEQALSAEVERALADADPSHRVGEPTARESRLRDAEALALFAQEVRQRDADVGEPHDRMAAGSMRAYPRGIAFDLPAGGVGRNEDQRVLAAGGGAVTTGF